MKKAKSIRWTLNAAALEFGIGPKTLSQLTKAKGIIAGKDGMFSTVQIAEAIYDSEHRERVRLLKEQADDKARKNKLADGEVCNIEVLADKMAVPLHAMKNVILSCQQLPFDDKKDLLDQLRQLWSAIWDKEITHKGAITAYKKAIEFYEKTQA